MLHSFPHPSGKVREKALNSMIELVLEAQLFPIVLNPQKIVITSLIAIVVMTSLYDVRNVLNSAMVTSIHICHCNLACCALLSQSMFDMEKVQ